MISDSLFQDYPVLQVSSLQAAKCVKLCCVGIALEVLQ